MSRERIPLSVGPIILGGGAFLLFVVLLVGFLLPTDWSVRATARLEAPPDVVFDYLDSPEGWQAWTTWPDSGLVRAGPERGAGASMSWDDAELGSGSFTVVEARPSERVSYEVQVESAGAMRSAGSIDLTPSSDGGVTVTWQEAGNLGRNPLMGYWALFMERAQTVELEKSLARLGEVAAGG